MSDHPKQAIPGNPWAYLRIYAAAPDAVHGRPPPAEDHSESDAMSLLSEYVAAKQQIDRLRVLLRCPPDADLECAVAELVSARDRTRAFIGALWEVLDGEEGDHRQGRV